MRKALVIRLGAIGDQLIASPIFPLLKADGFHTTFSTVENGKLVTKYNPYVDEYLMHDSSIPPDERLTEHWNKIGKGFDKIINLSESIEGTLSKVPWHDDFFWSQELRHKRCNVNFYDHTLAWAGYPRVKGKNAELYFSKREEDWAGKYRHKYKDYFMVLWSLSGSSVHKAYPYAEYVAGSFMNTHRDAMIITVGDALCQLIEWNHPRTKKWCGVAPLRDSLIMTKYADLVIGTDTGLLHAAGAFDTPKIIMHSSNTRENVSKYWANCYDLSSGVHCQPCHRLHYSMEYCESDPRLHTPLCMAQLQPKQLFETMEIIYDQWRKDKWPILSASGKDKSRSRTMDLSI